MHTVRVARRAGSDRDPPPRPRARSRCRASRQVRMIRTAISPRFAISMRRHGQAQPPARTSSRVSPYSTSLPSRARISRTTPRTPARTVFISFMTSMMPTMVSGSTRGAHLHERRRAGLRRAIEGAEQRRAHRDEVRIVRGRAVRRRWQRAPRQLRRGRRQVLPASRDARRAAAPQVNLEAVDLELELVEARILEQARDLGDVAGGESHRRPPKIDITWDSGSAAGARRGLRPPSPTTRSRAGSAAAAMPPRASMAHSMSCGRP